jgi:hypothetical protein
MRPRSTSSADSKGWEMAINRADQEIILSGQSMSPTRLRLTFRSGIHAQERIRSELPMVYTRTAGVRDKR